MRFKRLLAVLAAGMLVIVFASAGALAQVAPKGNGPVVQPGPQGLKVTLQVKVKILRSGEYGVQGKTEVYGIANQKPEILGPLAKSGETITIEARARGDLLTIETINGKKYEVKPQPALK
jgi:hypothetical protein